MPDQPEASRRLEETPLGGPHAYTRGEVAERAGASIDAAASPGPAHRVVTGGLPQQLLEQQLG